MNRTQRLGILIFMFLSLLLVAQPALAEDNATAEPTVQVTADQPAPDDNVSTYLTTAEEVTSNAIERFATQVFEHQSTQAFWTVVVIVLGFGLMSILLWNSHPNQRGEIKASAIGVLDKAETKVEQQVEAARLTPDPWDDVKYNTLLAVLNRVETLIATLPTAPTSTTETPQEGGQGVGLMVRGLGE